MSSVESPREDTSRGSPLPPQASPAAASPPSRPRSPQTVLATMTPVPVEDFEYCHKVEIDSNDGYPQDVVYDKGMHQDVYAEKGAIIYQHSPNDIIAYASAGEKVGPPIQGDIYNPDMGPIDEKTPIDLIYEDGKQTVIYTTTPDQKRVEMISGQLDDGHLITSGGQLVDGGVSVVVQGPTGQNTVLVLADHVMDEMGQVISIPRRRKEGMELGGEQQWRAYYAPAGHGSAPGEHPLGSATILEDGEGPQQHLVYEYYKLPPLQDAGSTATQIVTKDGKIADVWPSGAKAANGGQGAELAELQGLFHAGLVKREPEDLSRKVAAADSPEHSALRQARHKVLLVGSGGGGGSGGGSEGGAAESGGAPSRASSAGSLLPDAASAATAAMYAAQMFAAPAGGGSATPSPQPYADQPPYAAQYSRAGPPPFAPDPYYRDYFSSAAPETAYQQRAAPAYADSADAASAPFVERYVRQSYHGKGVIAAAGLTVDLPSPDSGIGADAITPRDQNVIQQSFDYTDLCQQQAMAEAAAAAASGRGTPAQSSPGGGVPARSRPWHDFGRQNDADKIQIPKLYCPYGFKYNLESPISSSQRREDDRITYINKGQFYGISLEYVHDPDKPIKNQTVKSVVMLMFREEKSPEDEIKAWQFWHGRQHSVKQRILDADTKNSVGLVGCIEEIAHNAIAVYWNPLESSAKINVAVQCLSTDFSSQKGVKGLPLHIQIDTFEDPRDPTVFHRGYCQIKVFCDKGAERKTRDEERRAAKRKMTATGRKKLDELYHPVVERSEFYAMADGHKPPVLFTPADDIDKIAGMELQGFYGHDDALAADGHPKGASPFLLHAAKPSTPTLKFHNHFPPDTPIDKKDHLLVDSVGAGVLAGAGGAGDFAPAAKRARASPPPLSERVMLYVRQDADDVYTPLHVAPPTTQGLLHAIENKYKISTSAINNLYRKNKKGITAKIDDEMLAYYCNEDLFLLEVRQVPTVDDDLYDITFVELPDH